MKFSMESLKNFLEPSMDDEDSLTIVCWDNKSIEYIYWQIRQKYYKHIKSSMLNGTNTLIIIGCKTIRFINFSASEHSLKGRPIGVMFFDERVNKIINKVQTLLARWRL